MKRAFIIAAVIGSNIILVTLWIWWGWDIGRVTHLTCAKVESTVVNCDLGQTWLRWAPLPSEARKLTSLQSVNFQEGCDIENCSYHVSFRTKNEQITVKATEEDAVRVTQLQAFIDGTADVKTFESSFGGSWFDLAGWMALLVALEFAATSPWWLEKLGNFPSRLRGLK